MSNDLAKATVNPYPEIIAQSFLEKSVRSALLIDDQFPMFNTPESELANFKQADRAKRLYRMFNDRKILCDIESRPAVLSDANNSDHLLKSDLVILDYHLNNAEDKDPSKALAILRNLSRTVNFNVVALYTASDDLKNVWLEVAASLRGGWKAPEKLLDDTLLEQWEKLEDEGSMPSPEGELLIEFLEKGEKEGIRSDSGKRLRKAFEDAGVDKKNCTDLICARISQAYRDRLPKASFDESVAIPFRGVSKGPFWIQCGNLFIAILKKQEPEAGEEESSDPEKIWDRLTATIQDWRPNLLQIMLSEIQNILVQGAVTIDVSYAGSPERQAGILYSLFNNVPDDNAFASDEFLFPAIEDFTWKLVESIRRHISTDEGLQKIAGTLIKYEMKRGDWKKLPTDRRDRVKKLLGFIKQHLMNLESVNDEHAFLELNAFHSTDKFRGSHLTTGTLFKASDEDSWWMCCSPACDMVPRPPSGNEWKRKPWTAENHPMKKMVALRLEPIVPPTKDLDTAEQGRSVYVHSSDGQYLQFKVMDKHNHLSWEIMLLEDAGKIALTAGNGGATFKADLIQAVTHSPEGAEKEIITCNLEKKSFSIVAQIRPEYANRILQYAGHHLSRIGVDFFNLQ